MTKGLVSVITPCYNGVKYIVQAIESVLVQTYQDFEMIIIDDCSVDDSVKIIDAYQKRDHRIKFYRTKTCAGSSIEPRNIGIERASGQYIVFLDDDDVWFPNKLDNQIKLFAEENAGLVYSNYEKYQKRELETIESSGRHL
jgi:teichuronic acid biosynthesis glycosyltransferase TuaG